MLCIGERVTLSNKVADQSTVGDALRSQLTRGFPWLVFAKHIEPGFQIDNAEMAMPYRRVLLCVSLFGIVVSILIDHFLAVLPVDLSELAWVAQLFVMLPFTLGALATTLRKNWQQYSEFSLLFAMTVLVLSLLAMRSVGVREGFDFPLEFTAITIAATFFLGRVPFWRVLPLVFLLCIALVLNEAMFKTPGVAGWYRVWANTLLVIVSIIGGYSFEYVLRESWLNRRLLEQLSNQDPLTGLPNRRAFDEAASRGMRQAVREQKPLGLAMIDIDCFKLYNDTYGHLAGDECLQKVAGVLQDMARRPLDCYSRRGGEEFVIAWFGSDAPAMQTLGETLLQRIRDLAIEHKRSTVAQMLTISMGLTTLTPSPDTTLAQILESADQAMYRAKRAGRNRMETDHKRPDGMRPWPALT